MLASSSLASRSCSLRCCLFQEREACRSASWRHRVPSRDGAGRGASARPIGGREFGSGCESYLEAPPPITEPWSVLGLARLGRATSRRPASSQKSFQTRLHNASSKIASWKSCFSHLRKIENFQAAPRSPMFRGELVFKSLQDSKCSASSAARGLGRAERGVARPFPHRDCGGLPRTSSCVIGREKSRPSDHETR